MITQQLQLMDENIKTFDLWNSASFSLLGAPTQYLSTEQKGIEQRRVM